jgi:hypothetical protein
MTKLYEEIKGECMERGLASDGSKCVYNRFHACEEHTCVQTAAFRGMRPPDMLLERGNLMEMYKADMLPGGHV